MSDSLATFCPPDKHLDLKAIGQSAIVALTLIKPWCRIDSDRSVERYCSSTNFTSDACDSIWSSSVIKQSIAIQARKYVGAIEYSVVAAQEGYNIADHALQLSASLQRKGSSSTERELFAQNMIVHSNNAYLKASRAVDKFRICRQAILPVRAHCRSGAKR